MATRMRALTGLGVSRHDESRVFQKAVRLVTVKQRSGQQQIGGPTETLTSVTADP